MMQAWCYGSIIILAIGAGVLSARLWCYRKQISHIREELAFLQKEDTNSVLSSFCAVGQTEKMIAEVNQLILHYREEVVRLEKENRVYRESITSISHDIRTPLTSAKGYLQMLRRDEIPKERKDTYLWTIEQRLDHLNALLNQLFEYARLEAGELKFEPEVLNAGNVFAETIALFYEDFVKKDCQPEVLITNKPCKINVDKQAFVRIVENLLKNALVHGCGGYEMSLTMEKKQCIIRVSNLTHTVEAGDVERIFDRFYTTDQSRTKKTTGLGLAIVKRFATEMGGDAKASLEGTRFTIEVMLPLWTEG